jgi:hypothetical protein
LRVLCQLPNANVAWLLAYYHAGYLSPLSLFHSLFIAFISIGVVAIIEAIKIKADVTVKVKRARLARAMRQWLFFQTLFL